MSENNNLLQSWGIGDLRIVEWENYNAQRNTAYLSYSLTKTEYEKPKNQGEKGKYKNIFSLSIMRREDFVIIYNLLRGRLKSSMGGYSFMPKNAEAKNNVFLLSKSYEDYKTHETKTQTAELNAYDILMLEELLRGVMDKILIARFLPMRQNNHEYGGSFYEKDHERERKDETDGSNNFIEKSLDDDIPF
jgi:hypothetical protein